MLGLAGLKVRIYIGFRDWSLWILSLIMVESLQGLG